MKNITINNQNIGKGYKPFIIAEMSANHNQSLERALQIVDAAAACGVSALKIQTSVPENMSMKGAYIIDDKKSLWDGTDLYELYKVAYTPWEWHQVIFDRAKEHGLIAFSSPFDASAVDFLETLDVPLYKIASFENTDHPLLKKVAQTGKPVIMSTGVTSLADIDEAVRVLRENGCQELVLLKCTSTYPASPETTNLATIPHLQKIFNCQVGLSDHTMGIGASVAAVALGASVIEKHFTLSRADGGLDSTFSLEPEELKALVIESERAYLALGEIKYGIQKVEKDSRKFKRSIYISKAIKKGELFTKDNTKVIRPGFGLEPKYLEVILGKKAPKDILEGVPLTWDLLLN